MLELGLRFFFGIMALRISKVIRAEARVLAEFGQSRALATLVWLFPLGPYVALFGSFYTPFPVAFIAAAGCYLPALLVARRQSQALETSGTDRVRVARAAITEAFGTALAGVIFLAVGFAFTYGAKAVAPSA
jgi:hypothetical protein